jgi:hypothetical protein
MALHLGLLVKMLSIRATDLLDVSFWGCFGNKWELQKVDSETSENEQRSQLADMMSILDASVPHLLPNSVYCIKTFDPHSRPPGIGPMFLRPIPFPASSFPAFANFWSADRKEINPNTSIAYSDDLSVEFTPNSSAAHSGINGCAPADILLTHKNWNIGLF